MRRILVSAYACEPLKGSEQGVGWNWVLQMAKNNYIHIITRANNRNIIEANLPKEISKNITFHYYDTNNFIKGLKNKAKGLYSYYFFWQLGIIPLIMKLKAKEKFDYSMHLTMGSIWMPTFLPFFKIPFIWGPVGGGEGIPKTFLSSLPVKQRVVQTLRYFLKYLNYLNPLFIYTCIKAHLIITRTNNTLDFIPKIFRHKSKVFLETSMEDEIFRIQKNINFSKEIQLVTTGRLVPIKNVITIIKALTFIPKRYKIKLTIIGSGNENERICNEIVKAKISNKINFIEETTREDVLSILSESDIYLFPSLREGGSWALMEAMVIGLPVICLNWSGMEIITNEQSAIRLPVSNPDQMPKDMADAICKLIDNPKLMERMGKAGRERIKNVFNWDAKGAFMENLFNDLDNTKKLES